MTEIKSIEKILTYYEIPLFFVAKDSEGQRYLLLSEENNEYLAARIKVKEILQLLKGTLSPYEFYQSKNNFAILKWNADRNGFMTSKNFDKSELNDDLLVESNTYIDSNEKKIEYYQNLQDVEDIITLYKEQLSLIMKTEEIKRYRNKNNVTVFCIKTYRKRKNVTSETIIGDYCYVCV